MEKENLRSTSLSLLIALTTCVTLFLPWSVSGNDVLRGLSLAILVEEVVVPNWVLGIGTVAIFALLRWRQMIHPFQSILFATIINGACVCHLAGLVSHETRAATTGGMQIASRLNVIPYLLLTMFLLQQVELAWRMATFLFVFRAAASKKNQKEAVPAVRRELRMVESIRRETSEKTSGLLQKLVRRLPWGLGESIEAESREWKATCRCGCERSIWDLGGIRYRASGEPLRFLHCPRCGAVGWHRVVRKPDAAE